MHVASPFHFLELSNATSFLQRSSSLLLESEAQNNLLLSSALTLAKASVNRSPRLGFYVVERSGKLVAAALNSTEKRCLLATSTDEFAEAAAEYLGRELSARETLVRGVFGPSRSAESFLTAFMGERAPQLSTATSPSLPPLQNVLKLTPPALSLKSFGASGLARVAKEKDLRLLLRWSRQFVEESGMDESERESELALRRSIETRQLYIWEDARPVAMAGFGGETPGGIRVSQVYTDPSKRGRGYAGSLVQSLSRKLLSDGHRACFLYVESQNAPATRVYEKIGYRTIGECRDLKFHSLHSSREDGFKVRITG